MNFRVTDDGLKLFFGDVPVFGDIKAQLEKTGFEALDFTFFGMNENTEKAVYGENHREYMLSLKALSDKYGRFSTYAIYNEFGNWDLWCRKYVMLGFKYYYDICKDDELKNEISLALCRHLDYIIDRINYKKHDITYAGLSKLKGINSSTILEPTVRLYNITGNERYLDWAKYIVDKGAVSGENIDEPICIDNMVCTACENDVFGSQICFEFEMDGKAVRLCDYASAGKKLEQR